ncbi:DUF3000 family protein [Bifidobacterium aquikefiri]|uniref:DUF3000 family protein n=1 Tax=Bifidobacterium aquikefiri TaxID=1653207 RepID=UPI0023F2B394|nr:DUF3000 family protein [Bifidobacterium aquikefiri]
MAEIYQFPAARQEFSGHQQFSSDATAHREGDNKRSAVLQQFEQANVPSAVWQAVESIRAMPKIPGMTYSEMPTPSSIADYGIGIEIQYPVILGKKCRKTQTETSFYGWIMVLLAHASDIGTHAQWQCVAYMREPKFEMNFDDSETHALLANVQQRLRNANAAQISGTISSTENHSFGMDESKIQDSYEIRASWTPRLDGQGGQTAADYVHLWSQLMLDFGLDLMDQCERDADPQR